MLLGPGTLDERGGLSQLGLLVCFCLSEACVSLLVFNLCWYSLSSYVRYKNVIAFYKSRVKPFFKKKRPADTSVTDVDAGSTCHPHF